MSLIPTIYSSTDPGAPVLTGLAGSGLSLLRALLKNGYGSGAGTKAGLGWTEDFSGTNKAVFRNSPTTGSGYRLRLDDTQTRVMRLRAYTTMTTVDAGTGPTPTTTQRSVGCLWPRSATTDATPRAWWAIGNERCFYLFVAAQSEVDYPDAAAAYFAGDLLSWTPGDGHHFAVSGSEQSTFDGAASTSHSRLFSADIGLNYAPDLLYSGLFVARKYVGTGGAAPLGCTATAILSSFYGSGGFAYPYPLNGGLLWQPAVVHEDVAVIRGTLPGLVVPLHLSPFADLQQVTGLAGMPAGVTWLAKKFGGLAPAYAASYQAQVLFETGQAWQ